MSEERFDLIARQLLRRARGDRSQVAFSRRMGFKSNVVARWESGQRFPTASVALRAMRLGGLDVDPALAELHPTGRGADVSTDEEVADWLVQLLGGKTQQHVAERAGVSASVVSRWLSGSVRLRLPDLLRCIEALTGILSTFVHRLAGLESAPAAAPDDPDRVYSAQEVVLRFPLASYLNILMRSTAYRRLPAHLPGWLADHAGTDLETVQQTLAAMEQAGLIRREGTHYASVTPAGLAHLEATREQVQHLRTEQLSALAHRTTTGAPVGPDDHFASMHVVCTREDAVEVGRIFKRAFAEARMYLQENPPDPATEQHAWVVALDLLTLA